MLIVRIFKLLSWLPLRWLHAIGALLGSAAYLLSPRNRQLTQEHLAQAKLPVTARQVLAENGRAVMELAWVWFRPAQQVLAHVQVHGQVHVEAARAQDKGVIFLTPHMGCFEICAQYLAAQAPITALYRPPRQAWMRPLVEDTRARHNLQLAPADGKGVRMMLKALKRGEAIGLLPDQVPGVSTQGGEGVWAPWFGRPAYTMTLPAKLAHGTGAPLVMVLAIRRPQGAGFDLHFSPFSLKLNGDAAHDAGLVNMTIEQLAALAPTQYWWSYNRYKAPAGVVAP
jgi:Kdo2-lipid IVA lauroyltransferase/acyltransferase